MTTKKKLDLLCDQLYALTSVVDRVVYLCNSPFNPVPGMEKEMYLETMEQLKVISGNLHAIKNNVPQLINEVGSETSPIKTAVLQI